MTATTLRERPLPGSRPGPGAGGGAAPEPPSRAPAPPEPVPSRLVVELALFAALGALGIGLWSRLVTDPPIGRLLLALVTVLAAGALIAWVAGRVSTRRRARLAAAAIALAATALACVVIGVPARLLALPNWPELLDNLSLGLAGIEDTELPYSGQDVWLRLTLLCGVPLLLGLAIGLAFWPARRRAPARTLALCALVALYAIPATLDSPGAELLWGVLLLVLAAAWLWLPRLEPRRAILALAVVAGAGVVALPAAARLDPATPWWDYEGWDWFGRDREVSFDWNHSYGPLEWPREGTTLLEVRSAEPLYWKASVLDRFDGFTWQRADGDDLLASAERLARRSTPGARLAERNRQWLTQASFEVESLSSGIAIGAGMPQPEAVRGLSEPLVSSDGTLLIDEPLRAGDEYSMVAYSPRPTPQRMRRAPDRYPERRFSRTTLIGLPATVAPQFEAGPTSSSAGPGAEAEEGLSGGFAPARPHQIALWGGQRDPDSEAAMLASPYAGVYRLARRLSADAETPYDAVRAIERHLQEGYDYSPNVPQHTYPLAAFLADDRSGYCQQFAGTMTLMLRMIGIPSRVVSGFAPGSLDAERGVYEVRDTDAHSWVEAYFRGIGWVTFDPTPAAAPAESRTLNAALAGSFRGRGAATVGPIGRGESLERGLEGGLVGPLADRGAGPWPVIGIATLGLALVGGLVAGGLFWRRRRRLVSGASVDAQLAALRRALPRLGWTVPREATLLAIERRFRSAGRGPIARYAAALRAHRYAPGSPAPPGPAARRALRRSLASGGLGRRLRALTAIPPGGPR